MNERIVKWVDTLDEDQLRHIAVDMLKELINSEYIMFPEDYDVPFWDSTGEDLC